MADEPSRIRCVVDGIVQGVGFRIFTRRVASELGVTGYVRNQSDGSVEVVAEGERDALRGLIERVERGPIGSHVAEVSLEWDVPTGEFTSFQVQR